MTAEVIDSQFAGEVALAQNPDNPCPEELLDSLELVEVFYKGFDKRLHMGQIVVAETVVPEVKAFFRQALALEFPIQKVVPAADPKYQWDDEKLMADNASSGFNYRVIAGTDTVSQHGLGLAFDINPRQNPYIRYENGETIVQPPAAEWNPRLPGTLNEIHPLVKMMEAYGWEWGGNWTAESGRVDYQHFQKAA
jgi:hypothetical protein